jgi:hypothetical protein
MTKRTLPVVTLAVVLLVLLGACGGGKKTTTTAAPPPFPFKATFSATSHRPVATSKDWYITATARDLAGKPIAASLEMNVLFGGAQVGEVDNGKVHKFAGNYREQVVWPKRSIGYALTVQAVIRAKGKKKTFLWPIKVVPK